MVNSLLHRHIQLRLSINITNDDKGRGRIRPLIGPLDFLFPVKSNNIWDESTRFARHFDTKFNRSILS